MGGGLILQIYISTDGTVPIYKQIEDQLTTAIFRGKLAVGAQLPSIRLLARELQISVITTRRAYEELEKAGLIYTVPGKGSFVAAQGQGVFAEAKRRLIREKLQEAVAEAKLIGLERQELEEMLGQLLGG